jgi:anti-sigma28 factor (negative regulator of flagellin synthesis)
MTTRHGAGDSNRTERSQRLDVSKRVRKAVPDAYTASVRKDSSAESKLLAAARELPAVRMDKVEAMRQKLADPEFNVDEALEGALRVMLKDEFGE